MSADHDVRTRRRFTWEAVPLPLLKAMLCAFWPNDREEILGYDCAEAAAWAVDAFGADPRRYEEPLDADVIDVLRKEWVPTLDASGVADIAERLERHNGAAPSTKPARVAWIRDRNRTVNLRWNLTRAFCEAHRADVPVRTRSVHREASARVRELRGQNAAATSLRQHQRDAHASLDKAIANGEPSALLVMPTGSGKTLTMVSWLLQRLEQEPELRVLWLAHRRELVDQAATAFEEAAHSRPTSFRRLLRSVHGAAAELITLADANEPVDVAVVTAQSLISGRRAVDVLDSLFTRPVIVVLDEAHHAGAEQTDGLLNDLASRSNHRVTVGLTATPFPTSIISHQRFAAHFPEVSFRVDAPPLIAEGVLARPTTVVVETGRTYHLAEDVVAKLERGSEPSGAFGVLDEPFRNRLVARLCNEHRRAHGPTLLFAASIAHADALCEAMAQEGVEARPVHSASAMSMPEARRWFESATDAVLVSVGMLNEGVDLPRARTAFLARPTVSRILMQQMVGRVLRGPKSGGESDAYVVYLSDQFDNYSDLLDPAEVLDQYEPKRRHGLIDEPSSDTPDVQDDEGRRVPFSVVGPLGRMMRQPLTRTDPDGDLVGRPFDTTLTPRELIGYYELPTVSFTELDHQQVRWDELIGAALAGERTPRHDIFASEPPPWPSRRATADMVAYVRRNGAPPPFRELRASLGPSRCVDRLIAAGAMTEQQRSELIEDEWRRSVNAEVSPTVDHFAEAVERELRDRRRTGRLRHTPVSPNGRQPTRRARLVDERPLRPLFEETVERGAVLLQPHLRRLLDDLPATPVWSQKAIHHLFAYWVPVRKGRDKGSRRIVVSSLYRTTPEIVTDEMLRYLLWHELLHDVLPGQQHDAEFRTLEHGWPNAAELDAAWETLHDRYRFPSSPRHTRTG